MWFTLMDLQFSEELYQNVDSVFKTWKTLLTSYLTSIDEEVYLCLHPLLIAVLVITSFQPPEQSVM